MPDLTQEEQLRNLIKYHLGSTYYQQYKWYIEEYLIKPFHNADGEQVSSFGDPQGSVSDLSLYSDGAPNGVKNVAQLWALATQGSLTCGGNLIIPTGSRSTQAVYQDMSQQTPGLSPAGDILLKYLEKLAANHDASYEKALARNYEAIQEQQAEQKATQSQGPLPCKPQNS